MERSSRAVLVVRNNQAHGEKTRCGPNHERVQCNSAVAKIMLPVLEDIIDFVLDRPSRKILAYGTLRPGQPNHGVITGDGTWTPVSLRGVPHEESGLPAFTFADSAAMVDADLYASASLPSQWRYLDRFECVSRFRGNRTGPPPAEGFHRSHLFFVGDPITRPFVGSTSPYCA